MGDVLGQAAPEQSIQGQDIVYANLTGKDLNTQAKNPKSNVLTGHPLQEYSISTCSEH